MMKKLDLKNWAGNYDFRAARLHRPKSLQELQEIVVKGKKLKVIGTRHSFNGIADSDEDLISMEYFNRVLAIDRERPSVIVEAGVKYGDLCRCLHGQGYALHNLASLPHTTLAGAVATGTHGSGDGNGSLATAVSSMEFVNGEGEIIVLSRDQDGEEFRGAVVSLGGLGVVTKLTLDVLPTFEMRQDVYQNLSLEKLEDCFDEIFSSAYSVSLFTDWRTSNINQVWMKRRVEPSSLMGKSEATLYDATLAEQDLHPIDGISAINCTSQMGVTGHWYERLPHFRMNFTPSSGEELQAEYLVPRHHGIAALRSIYALRQEVAPLVQISELRTIAADDLWMSPCFKQGCVGFHFTLKQDWLAVKSLLPKIEEALAPYEGRPHWGKCFTMTPTRLQSLYAQKLQQFRHLLLTHDPQGKFRNEFLNTYIFDEIPAGRL